jgi:nickel-dependent lactate racemase
MTDLALPWGDGQMKASLPENWTIQQIAEPTLRPAPQDWPDRLALALGQPISGLPLDKLLCARPNGRIVIVVEDMTRHSPLETILQVVLREIRHAKIADEQIEILFATGMHPPLKPDEARKKLGPEALAIKWRCNPWHDKAAHLSVGKVGKIPIAVDRGLVQADLRILISSVSPHLQAGFGGGYKMIVPGCASLDTVHTLHNLSMDRKEQSLVGTEAAVNVMRQNIDAAGQLVDARGGKTFSIQYVLDGNDLPTAIAAGDCLPTQQMLAKQCAVSCGVLVNTPADVLIANAYPRDFDLWQTFKCIANTRWAARKNGVIICLSRCTALANECNPPPWPLGPKWTRRIVSLLGPTAIASLVTRLVPRLARDAAFFVSMAAQAYYRNHILIVSPELHKAGVKFPGLEMFASIEQAVARTQLILGTKPQRVIVFPFGGITFPVLPFSQKAIPDR